MESGGLFGDVFGSDRKQFFGQKKMHHFFRDTVPAPPRPSFLILDEFSTIGWLFGSLVFSYTQLIFPLGIGDSGKERISPPTLSTFFGYWLKHCYCRQMMKQHL